MNRLCMVFLAQDTPAPTAAPASNFFFLALMAGVIVFMILSARSQRRREQRGRETMFAKLAKNDRVQTVGGVIGTIMAVKDSEVVIKVDETTNTKMTFVKTAIQRVLSDNGPGSSEKQ